MADISKIKLPNGTTYNIKDETARSNSGVTGVKGSAESSYRTGNVNLTAANVGAANAVHHHLPNEVFATNTYGLASNMDMLSGAKIGSYASNKTFGLPASAITIEYSKDGGNTWQDYGASDLQKRNLFAETRGTPFYIGKSTTADQKSLNDRLRITIEPTDRYVTLGSIYMWYSTQGNTTYIDLERSTIGNKNSYVTVFTDQQISGWSGHNIRYFQEGSFGGDSTQTSNFYNYRITFKMTALSSNYPAGIINDIRFFGKDVYSNSTGNNMISSNHLYSWDANMNAQFPANVTATQFNGPLNGNASTASLATDVGEASIKIHPQSSNEVNFGGSFTGNTDIFIGYRAIGNRQIPTRFLFGGSTGTARLQAKDLYFGSSGAYITSTEYTGHAASASILKHSSNLSADTIDSFHPAELAYARATSLSGIGLVGNDGILVWIPYNANYGRQIIFDDTNHTILSRYYNNGTWSTWKDMSDAATVNGHTVNSDVPSNAKFTDTTISMSMDTTDTKKLIISLT